MKDAHTTKEDDKALAKSISFYPSTLYTRADKFAGKQDPKRSTSSIVCEALAEYLAKNDPEHSDETAAALAQIEAAASKDATLAAELLAFIRTRKRTRRAGR